MAAVSARCLRSLAKSSCILGRATSSTSTLIKGRQLSSLVTRSSTLAFKDSGLLQKIARDAMAKNLARRHTRLSTAISQHLLVVAVDLAVEGGEGAGDELSSEIISDEDDQLRI